MTKVRILEEDTIRKLEFAINRVLREIAEGDGASAKPFVTIVRSEHVIHIALIQYELD